MAGVVLMTGDKGIMRSTIAAVGVVALVAGLVSYRHAPPDVRPGRPGRGCG